MYSTSLSRNIYMRILKPNCNFLILATVFVLLGTAVQVNAENTHPRLDIRDVVYKGGFRIPADTFGSSSANFSYGAIAYNGDKHSLFLAGHEYHRAIAEFPIPALVNSRTLNQLNIADSPIQNFVNILDKAPADSHGNGVRINGIHYYDGRLMVNNYSFYDQAPFHSTNTLIFRDASNLESSMVDGYFTMEGRSYAAGWISPVPDVWQAGLGGTHLGGFTSSTSRALIYSSSVGPAAYSFNASSVMENSATITDIGSTELLKYTLEKGMITDDDELYNKNGTNKLWTHASEGSFGMIVPGTKTYMVLGMSGGHNSGMSYGDPPYGGYKGHYTNDEFDKYPYYWLYDVDDLLKVRRGLLESHEVLPYSAGEFDVPFQTNAVNPISGGSFDSENGIMYLSVYQADTEQGSGTNTPVIVAYEFELTNSVLGIAAPSPPINPTKVVEDR